MKQVREDKVTAEMRDSFIKEVELLRYYWQLFSDYRSGLRPHANVVQFLAACTSPLCMVIGSNQF